MTAEHILDAMNELPDAMLEQVDSIRNRKPFRWKLLATAACLCLALGIAYSFAVEPAEKSSDNMAMAPELGGILQDEADIDGADGAFWWNATVTAVEEEKLTAVLDSGAEVTVLLTQLEEKPALIPGQRIRIYLEEETFDEETPLKPYKIEIEEELP